MAEYKTILRAAAPLLLSSALVATPAFAADHGTNSSATSSTIHRSMSAKTTTGSASVKSNPGKRANENHARELLKDALAEVRKMERNPQLDKAIAKAKGIYLVPDFGRGALIVGGRGGAGVVLAHVNGRWTSPVFYDFGAISFGAQAGGSDGPVAFLLMSQNAVDQFKSGNKISLNAGSGFTVVNFSANAQASWGKGDIVFWSNTKGAYAGATVSVTDINFADANNKAYYGRKVDPSEVLAGRVKKPDATQLKQALPS
jgi:SH3 domain-containing YSC84-like protein 1